MRDSRGGCAPSRNATDQDPAATTPTTNTGEIMSQTIRFRFKDSLRWPPWLAYGFAVVLTVAVVFLRARIVEASLDQPTLILFVLPIALSALWGGLGAGLVATSIAGLGSAWLIEPVGRLAISARIDLLQWALLLASGTLISVTSEALHRSRREAFDRLGALRESERRYRELFEANPHPMAVYDRETLAFLAVNDAAVMKYGYSRDEFLAMTLKSICLPDDLPKLLDAVAGASSVSESSELWRQRLKDGTEIVMEMTSHSLVFGGRPARVLLANDVSARVAAEQEIQRLNADLERRVLERTEQLKEANRELETFAYTVSHDLKAPLRGIDGYSRLLEEDHVANLSDEGVTFVGNIRRGVAQLQQLIDDLLAYSRMERRTLNVGTVDVEPLVERVLHEREDDLASRGVRIVRVVTAGLTVRADRDGLTLALRNLLDNALKFTRDASPPVIEVGAKAEGDTCVVWVRDNGIGFDMKFHDRLYEIFQRLQRAEEYSGTGIGLTIVRKAVTRMGGRVWAQSEPGRGATFFLELPR
jgi:PAS domain S-box-containing protein